MTTRHTRLASVFLLSLLLADSLLSACAGGASIRRSREDAWLLSIAGYYQLTGQMPTAAMASGPRPARLADASVHAQEPTTPNEAWTLFDYYAKLREQYERDARAKGLPEDVIQKGLAEIDSKLDALGERANALQDRRARHRGTAWKRFFDGLGRFIGRAFDIGGRIVKLAVEDVPGTIGEYAPAVIKGLAQAYVEKLKGELRARGEQKAFEILVEKNPNLAGAYLIFKAGKEGLKVLRDFARLFGRHRGGGAAQGGAATESPVGEEFRFPTSGSMTATCQWPSGAQSVADWCPTVQGTLTTNSPLTVTIDFSAHTFTFGYSVACEGLKKTDSKGGWVQSVSSDAMQGGGTVYDDGWLLGEGAGMYTWIEQGTQWTGLAMEPIDRRTENSSITPVAILLDTPDDMVAFELGWAAGGPTGGGLSIERAREVGWKGLLGFAPDCTTCVSLCEVTAGP
jgi:hypothetical protein